MPEYTLTMLRAPQCAPYTTNLDDYDAAVQEALTLLAGFPVGKECQISQDGRVLSTIQLST